MGCARVASAAAADSCRIRESRHELATVLRDRRSFGFTAVLALGSGMLFCYIQMSPFVLQGEYGLSAQSFSLVFAANSVGLILGGPLSAGLVRRFGPGTTLSIGLTAGLVSAVTLATSAALHMGLAVLLPLLFVTVSSVSLIMPTSTALALSAHQSRAEPLPGCSGWPSSASGDHRPADLGRWHHRGPDDGQHGGRGPRSPRCPVARRTARPGNPRSQRGRDDGDPKGSSLVLG